MKTQILWGIYPKINVEARILNVTNPALYAPPSNTSHSRSGRGRVRKKRPFLLATQGPMYPTVLEVVPRIRYFPSPPLANCAKAGCVKRQKRNTKDKKRKVIFFMFPPRTILIQPFSCPSIQHLGTDFCSLSQPEIYSCVTARCRESAPAMLSKSEKH